MTVKVIFSKLVAVNKRNLTYNTRKTTLRKLVIPCFMPALVSSTTAEYQ